MITIVDAAALFVAGVLAGLVGSAGGITSLVSFPALLAVGLPARTASIVNVVANLPSWPGSALASRSELRGTGNWLVRSLPVAALGSAAGSVLLRKTSATVFEHVVLRGPRLSVHHE